MVPSDDVPSDFNLASFSVRPDFRVFQHNRSAAAVWSSGVMVRLLPTRAYRRLTHAFNRGTLITRVWAIELP